MSIFSNVSIEKPNKSVFNLSHSKKLTATAGEIVPVFCQYTMPGDKFNINVSTFARTLAMLSPMMQNVQIDIHFFNVPLRLIWSRWERFISGPERPKRYGGTDEQEPVHPYSDTRQIVSSALIAANSSFRPGATDPEKNEIRHKFIKKYYGSGSLADYFGFPTFSDSQIDDILFNYIDGNPLQVDNSVKIDLFPFLAYAKIYNDWFRDENLIDPIPILYDGKDPNTNYSDTPYPENEEDLSYWFPLRSRAWKKDYFTSALPFPQRGDDVLLPLVNTDPTTNVSKPYLDINANNITIANTKVSSSNDVSVIQSKLTSTSNSGTNSSKWNIDNLKADISNLRSSTIIEIRRAFALQKWFENSARLGARYIEQMLAHFGVQSSDARLQRPEFLGGMSVPLSVDSVVQTSSTTTESPQGNQSGIGTAIGGNHICKCFCEEHSLIIGLMTIRPQSQYILGLPRQFNMFERFDFPFPEFANIGEQAILRQEIYCPTHVIGHKTYKETFGYAPRYSEFKFIPSTVHGEFKDSLNYWTMARRCTPYLNKDFIEITNAKEANNRPFAFNDSEHQYIVQVNFDVTAVRPLPYYSVPGYLDH